MSAAGLRDKIVFATIRPTDRQVSIYQIFCMEESFAKLGVGSEIQQNYEFQTFIGKASGGTFPRLLLQRTPNPLRCAEEPGVSR